MVLYERKGLVKMTEYLNAEEQVLFDAVQGAFSNYLYGQFKQAQKAWAQAGLWTGHG
jgi:hypothetical protein